MGGSLAVATTPGVGLPLLCHCFLQDFFADGLLLLLLALALGLGLGIDLAHALALVLALIFGKAALDVITSRTLRGLYKYIMSEECR